MAFLPDGRILVTEKQPGQLRIVSPDGKLSEPVAGLPAVDARNQGGLLDVALDPAFAKNRLIYGATPSRARMASTIVPSPAAASMHRLRRRAWTRSA
jgi:glucose/arabinose dehydrogenase